MRSLYPRIQVFVQWSVFASVYVGVGLGLGVSTCLRMHAAVYGSMICYQCTQRCAGKWVELDSRTVPKCKAENLGLQGGKRSIGGLCISRVRTTRPRHFHAGLLASQPLASIPLFHARARVFPATRFAGASFSTLGANENASAKARSRRAGSRALHGRPPGRLRRGELAGRVQIRRRVAPARL